MSSYPGLKTMYHDPDYYAEALRAFARLSSKYQVLATWTDTVFPKKVVERLAVDLTDTNGKLKVLGIGSGTGEVDCNVLQQLLVRYPNISNTVIEPDLKPITEYKALASRKGYTGIEWDWRQQTWEQYYQDLKKPGREVDKMHFISAVQSLYHVTDDLETTILNMFHHLREGGILMIVLTSERTGACRLINRFPLFTENLHSRCNSKHVRDILKKHTIDFEVITQESQLDITCCFEEGNEDGPLILDFVAQTLNLKETAPSKLVDEVLEYMRGPDCSVRRGEKILLSNDWEAIIVTKE